MDSNFTVITPTGDRPESLALCLKFLMRQTIKPKEWIIVDDGVVSSFNSSLSLPFIKFVRRDRTNQDPEHTLRLQIIEAFKHVSCEICLIMEDDDWYYPTYFASLLEGFNEGSLLVGLGDIIFYHIPTRHFRSFHSNVRSAWCQTGFHSSLIPAIIEKCRGKRNPWLDKDIWNIPSIKKHILTVDRYLCVGIKGLPGRPGLSQDWLEPEINSKDPDGRALISFIGEDVKLYKKWM